MPDISEHNTEKERECDNGKEPWVYFTIARKTIGVYKILEGVHKLDK